MEYTIKNVCEKLNLTIHTVRHYCDMGLVPNLKRDEQGNRIFDDESLNWLQAAAFLRASGLSIPKIKHYFDLCLQGDSALEQRYEILQNLKQKTEEEYLAARYRLECITQKTEHYRDILDGKCPDDCNPLNW